ncbi:MAG: hypothetical protein SFX72_08605 [Isosphaeraceae bacterium]|nr:hypothetical protein [Isosphaeraceae bacterium]
MVWFLLSGLFAGGSSAADLQAPSVEEVRTSIDLSTWPMYPKGEPRPFDRRIPSLSYAVSASIAEVVDFHRKQLSTSGWVEAPNPYLGDESANIIFRKNGYTLSLTASKSEEKVNVSLTNHGNLSLSELPLPEGATPLFAMAYYTSHTVPGTKSESRAFVDRGLIASGWIPYGLAGDSRMFKKKAVLLNARVFEAPAQQGKTVVEYMPQLISADLPVPPGVESMQYADTTKRLDYKTPIAPDEIYAFYAKQLAPGGWKPTTERPVTDGKKSFQIHRNAQGDLITVEIRIYDDQSETTVQHQTAAEVEEERRRGLAAEAARKKQLAEAREKAAMKRGGSPSEKSSAKPGTKTKLAIGLPANSSEVERTASSLRFQLPVGSAKSFIEATKTRLEGEGWKVLTSTIQEMGGSIALTKGEMTISATFIESGILPGQVIMQAVGVEFDATTPR